jgi:hypothetical protein
MPPDLTSQHVFDIAGVSDHFITGIGDAGRAKRFF